MRIDDGDQRIGLGVRFDQTRIIFLQPHSMEAKNVGHLSTKSNPCTELQYFIHPHLAAGCARWQRGSLLARRGSDVQGFLADALAGRRPEKVVTKNKGEASE